jgi:hypothetical protein
MQPSVFFLPAVACACAASGAIQAKTVAIAMIATSAIERRRMIGRLSSGLSWFPVR